MRIMDRNSRASRVDDVLSEQMDDVVVLLHAGSGRYYTLDDVGGRVWELCDGQTKVSEIVAAICREYDAPPETIEGDVLELLIDFANEGLINEGLTADAG
jgi:hypothetical protein